MIHLTVVCKIWKVYLWKFEDFKR